VEFEFDEPKSQENKAKHGIDFVEAQELWLDDALVLTLPEKVLCRPDCAGLCEVCGASLNDVDPAEHSHERPPDPRFAKLRELIDDE
jgi:uncharacterized metal-binding protein YceD (DUF177 family)